MQVFCLNNHQFKKLQLYDVSGFVKNVECELYIIDQKEKWIKDKVLLKKFYRTEGSYFSNKLYTINELVDRSNEFDDSFVNPSKLAIIGNEVVGYIMPFVEKNVNLVKILDSDAIGWNEKLDLLKDIGKIIEKAHRIKHFALGDIHEGNFIYDKEKDMLRVVDMDSCHIGNNSAPDSKYLTFNPNLWHLDYKYPLDNDDRQVPNYNTMVLSYIYLILNTIAQTSVYKLSIEQYYEYLYFLKQQGISKELLTLFSYIYDNHENENPYQLLDALSDISFCSYQKKK